ncbi:hypothetical protein CRUP_026725, partial [Coryphaenoides rupestris]
RRGVELLPPKLVPKKKTSPNPPPSSGTYQLQVLRCLCDCLGTPQSEDLSRPLRRHGWAYSNVAGLLGSALALGLYCFSLSSLEEAECEEEPRVSDCLEKNLENFFWCVTVLLLCYDAITLLLQGVLTVTSIRALRGR